MSAIPDTRRIHGVPVRISNDGAHATDEYLVRQITGALDLIARYQPHRLRRMPGDMDAIWVREHTMCRAAFVTWPDLAACVLDTYFVATFPQAQIAASIVHEGIHGRVRRAGIPWTDDQRQRAREERLCRSAEIRFGLAIPDGEAIVERAWQSMLLDDEGVAPRIAGIPMPVRRR